MDSCILSGGKRREAEQAPFAIAQLIFEPIVFNMAKFSNKTLVIYPFIASQMKT